MANTKLPFSLTPAPLKGPHHVECDFENITLGGKEGRICGGLVFDEEIARTGQRGFMVADMVGGSRGMNDRR